MAYLDITDLRVEYEKNTPILDHFNLSVERGQLVSLLGPSGCGKTTTLRSVAGFIAPSGGRVVVDGQDITRLAPNKRDIGLVFQSYALFPHLSVFQNVAFGLRMRRFRAPEIERRVNEALALVGLLDFKHRRPAQLSGGQRQRVALARAVVVEPKLLLLDEPLSNLDAKLRVSMRSEIRRLQQRLERTSLYVTHDQVEALAISDVVVVMNRGRIEQIGSPEDIFVNPKTAFVADFLGFSNRLDVRIASVDNRDLSVDANSHRLGVRLREPRATLRSGQAASLYFRPDTAALSSEPVHNSVPGQVLLRTFHGTTVQYIVQTQFGEILVNQDTEAPAFDLGLAHVVLNPDRLILIEKTHDET